MHKKWTDRIEMAQKKTSHCKSRGFLRKRRLKRESKRKCKKWNFTLWSSLHVVSDDDKYERTWWMDRHTQYCHRLMTSEADRL